MKGASAKDAIGETDAGPALSAEPGAKSLAPVLDEKILEPSSCMR